MWPYWFNSCLSFARNIFYSNAISDLIISLLILTIHNILTELIRQSLPLANNFHLATSVLLWAMFLATDKEVLGSIPGVTRFSEQ
jgi:hypothetical protein